MTRWWRWTLALLLCAAGAVLGPTSSAAAAPVTSVGAGTVVADLGIAWAESYASPVLESRPGFSPDGAYFAYLVPASDRCDLRLFDVRGRKPVSLSDAHVVCDHDSARWAVAADTLVWQVPASGGNLTVHAWDATAGQVTVLAPDARLSEVSGVSADGRFLAFLGVSDAHPAPAVDAAGFAGYVYDRTRGASSPLSKPHLHVHFVSWAPSGHTFIADTGGHTTNDTKDGGCFGSGASCRALPSLYSGGNIVWSRDGTAVIVAAGSTAETHVYDFTDASVTSLVQRVGFDDYAQFLGDDARRVLVDLRDQAAVWDRTTGKVTTVRASYAKFPSPTGRTVLYGSYSPAGVWRYLDPANPTEAAATYRGTSGYWTEDGSSFIGVGPAPGSYPFGCSSLRQWSPATNTVSLFGPPGLRACYHVPDDRRTGPRSSATGRFALFEKIPDFTRGIYSSDGPQEYVVDLRRHVLLGPLQGYVQSFAPAGSDVLALDQPLESGTARLLLVDPTPVPDVDDKPRWSAATPPTGARVEAAPGGSTRVQLGASDLQQTPVNLYFRWRSGDGTPVASAPKGWTCDRRRLAAGATVADCTFKPPARDATAVRFLDVSATNDATGAQSDTRSYRVGTS